MASVAAQSGHGSGDPQPFPGPDRRGQLAVSSREAEGHCLAGLACTHTLPHVGEE